MPKPSETAASKLIDEHPDLGGVMERSQKFAELKKRLALPKDDEENKEEEQLYIVRGDTVGDEQELFIDALARGSNPETQDVLARELFLEMDEPLQALIMGRFRK